MLCDKKGKKGFAYPELSLSKNTLFDYNLAHQPRQSGFCYVLKLVFLNKQ